jgi:hypothetical protein
MEDCAITRKIPPILRCQLRANDRATSRFTYGPRAPISTSRDEEGEEMREPEMYREAVLYRGQKYEALLFDRLCRAVPRNVLARAQAQNKCKEATRLSQEKGRQGAHV